MNPELKGLQMRHLTFVAAAAAALAIGVGGCGGGSSSSGSGQSANPVDPNAAEVSPAGDIPDNQAFVAYSPAGAGYSVKVPEGWGRRISGGAVTFTDKLNAVRIETRPAHAAPAAGEAARVELRRLAKTVRGFGAAKTTTVTRKAGQVVLITYLAKAKADPVTGKSRTEAVERYLFFHKGKELVLTLSGPKGADNVDPWRIVTDSVRWSG